LSAKACFQVVHPLRLFIHSSDGLDRACYHDISQNCFHNLVETYREYLLACTDDLIRFWRSEVKVTAGPQGQIL